MARAKKRVAKRMVSSTAKLLATTTVAAWQDDPESGLNPIDRPVPKLSTPPLRFKFNGAAIPPGKYTPGTAQFRYWTAAEALRRGADFFAPLLDVKHWEPGATLPVTLDKGVDLNAYYDRTELAFFHQKVNGTTYYSGESPDVACHEMGHACLDAHRPELFDAPYIEAAAFHESFGDMTAMLSALQLPSVRSAVLAGVKAYKSTPLSRCAEQLGHAIRLLDASAVDADSLRDAFNKFKYVDPNTLPDSAPATALCAEAHSFSRVFSGAFYQILSGMLAIRSASPKEAELLAVATDLAMLLVDATAVAPVQPNYFAQVAAHMIDADTARFGGRYREALTTIFVKRDIVPKSAVHALATHTGKLPPAVTRSVTARVRPPSATHKVVLDASEFGLGDERIVAVAPIEQKPFLSAAAGLAHRYAGTDSVEQATHRFVKSLFAHERVDVRDSKRTLAVTHQTPREDLRKTHVLIKTSEGLKLTRRLFHCGSRDHGHDER